MRMCMFAHILFDIISLCRNHKCAIFAWLFAHKPPWDFGHKIQPKSRRVLYDKTGQKKGFCDFGKG